MRAVLAAAALLSATLALGPAEGQDEQALFDDPEGDTLLVATVAGQGVPTPFANDVSAAVDLVSLGTEETDEAFAFVLGVRSLEGPLARSAFAVDFDWRTESFRAVLNRFGVSGGSGAWGYLLRETVDGYDWVGGLEADEDTAAAKLRVVVPKAYVMDDKQRIPGRGDSITNLWVRSEQPLMNLVARTYVSDLMPDDGPFAAGFVFVRGDRSSGNLVLSAPERLRVSNGGATTFVFQVTLANLGPTEEEYAVGVENLPPGWTATVQTPVRVGAKAEKTIPVLASIPFAHEHGGHDSFNVTATSTRDPETSGRMRLGVLHTPIPQPAGHHDTLFLHASGSGGGVFGEVFRPLTRFNGGWMNTNDTHEDESTEVGPNSFRTGARSWYLFLNPSLQIGLDFDLSRNGTFDGVLKGGLPGRGEITAGLYLWRNGGNSDEGTLLAEAEASEIVLDPQTSTPFSLKVVPTEEADYVPHAPGQSLYLVVTAKSESFSFGFSPVEPALGVPEFRLQLPLLEYHDRLDGLSEAANTMTLVAEGPVEKVARPGTTVTYSFLLRNGGSSADEVRIDAAGNEAALATVVPSGAVALEAGGERRVTLAVAVPDDATAGRVLDVLVFAYSATDPSRTAIARTSTVVSTGSDAVADESSILLAAQEAERATPGLGVVLVAAAGVAALARRRRDQRSTTPPQR